MNFSPKKKIVGEINGFFSVINQKNVEGFNFIFQFLRAKRNKDSRVGSGINFMIIGMLTRCLVLNCIYLFVRKAFF